MPEPKDWKEDDLQALIDEGVKESSALEYKACPALDKKDSKKKNEVGKDVSAMANAAGGTIIYGIIEKRHEPKKLDDGYDPAETTREWLEDVITSNMQPKIDPLVIINQVELEKTRAGRVAYVVCVPQSERRPHQAKNYKYYRRKNFKADPMEDYEIREMMFRQDVPQVELLEMSVRPIGGESSGGQSYKQYCIEPEVENRGRTLVLHFAVELRIPFVLTGIRDEGRQQEKRGEVEWRVQDEHVVFLLVGIGPLFPSQTRILPGVIVRAEERTSPEKVWKLPPKEAWVLPFVIYADNMPLVEDVYSLLDAECIDRDFGESYRNL